MNRLLIGKFVFVGFLSIVFLGCGSSSSPKQEACEEVEREEETLEDVVLEKEMAQCKEPDTTTYNKELAQGEIIPEFELPPPTPSAEGRMPKDIFSDCANLLDVDNKLTNALFQCGYENVSYFYIPTGFALVTQLEQIDPSGFSLGDYRWSITTIPNFREGFSLAEYFRLLVGAKSGYYRCFVFLITKENLIKSDEEPNSNIWAQLVP